MAISIDEFCRIADAREKMCPNEHSISLGEMNEIMNLYELTANTDCVNFDRETWSCDKYGWSICVFALTGKCEGHKTEEVCGNCRHTLNPVFLKSNDGKLITKYLCSEKNIDVYENSEACREHFENKREYAKGSCSRCYSNCKNNERCTAVGVTKCDYCEMEELRDSESAGDEE